MYRWQAQPLTYYCKTYSKHVLRFELQCILFVYCVICIVLYIWVFVCALVRLQNFSLNWRLVHNLPQASGLRLRVSTNWKLLGLRAAICLLRLAAYIAANRSTSRSIGRSKGRSTCCSTNRSTLLQHKPQHANCSEQVAWFVICANN